MLKLYLDAIEHQDQKILEACTCVIIERFEEIVAQHGNLTHMIELDIENLLSILKSDKLNLVNESTLVDLVREYIRVRDEIPSKLPETAEERAGPELWALLTDTERENRELSFKEEEEKKQTVANEKMENEAALYFQKDKTGKIQHVLNVKQAERNERIKVLSNKQKLSDQDKERILKCIRYSYVQQDILLRLSTDPDFTLAKEFIVQGIAVKLGGAAQFGSDQLKINTKPRQIVEQTIDSL